MRNMLGIKKLSVVVLTAMILTSGLVVLLDGIGGSQVSPKVEEMVLGEQVVPTGEVSNDPYTEVLYHFDEGSGTVVHDETGSYDGDLINGATWTEGRWGNAVYFDGVDDYLDTNWLVQFDADEEFTVEFWFKTPNMDNHYSMPIFGVEKGSGNGHPRLMAAIRMKGHNAYPGFYVEYGDDAYNLITIGTDESSYDDNEWHNFAFVRGGDRFTMYIDGCEVANVPDTITSATDITDTLWLGDRERETGANYKGCIDEFRISRIARKICPLIGVSTDRSEYEQGEVVEVTTEYFDGPAQMNADLVSPTGDLVSSLAGNTSWARPQEADEHTVALWHFDETSGTTLADSSSNNNHGSTNGVNWDSGKFDNCGNFMGGSNSYVSIPNDPTIELDSTDYTIEGWLYPRSLETKHRSEIMSARSGLREGFSIHMVGEKPDPVDTIGALNMYHWGKEHLNGKTPIPMYQWTHFAVTYDYSEMYAKLYVNGVLDDEGTVSHMNSYDNGLIFSLEPLVHREGWDGLIDEVRISNVVREPSEFNLGHYAEFTFDIPQDAPVGEYTIEVSNSIDTLVAETTILVKSKEYLIVNQHWTGADYSTIQAAIDNSDEGYHIYVHSGTYNERITIDKQLTIIGNGSATTIIDGNEQGSIVTISADEVDFSGFQLINAGHNNNFDGIDIFSNYNTVSDCITSENMHGIALFWGSEGNTITRNTCMNSIYNGIHMHPGYNNLITYNTLKFNGEYGVGFNENSNYNTAHHNIFIDNYDSSHTQGYDGGQGNLWDDGSEGNYWSDYTGSDADEDGIGDIPYQIYGPRNSVDRYPLIPSQPEPSCDLSIIDNEVTVSNENPYERETVFIDATIHEISNYAPSASIEWERYITEIEEYPVAYPTNIVLQTDDDLLVFHFTRGSETGIVTNLDPENGDLNWMHTKKLSSKIIVGANVDSDGNIYVGNAYGGRHIWKLDPEFQTIIDDLGFSSSGMEYVSHINPVEDCIYVTGYRGSGYGGGSALAKLDYSLNKEWEVNVRHSEAGRAWNQYFITEPVGDSVWRAGRDRSSPDRVRIIEHDASNGNVLKDISWPTSINNVNFEYMPGFVYSENDDIFLLSRIEDTSNAIINGLDTDGNVLWETEIPDHQVSYTAFSNNLFELRDGYYLLSLEDSEKKTAIAILDNQGNVVLLETLTENNTYRTKAVCLGPDDSVFIAQEGYNINSNVWDENDVRILKIALDSSISESETSFESYLIGTPKDDDGNNVQGIAVGDIDGDGDEDVVSGTYNDGYKLYILENDGSPWGTWDAHYIGSANGYINGVVIADLDNDGDYDIFTGDWGHRLILWRNDGTFDEPWYKLTLSAGGYVAGVAVADVDDDGDLDLASTYYETHLRLWKNIGDVWSSSSWNPTYVGSASGSTRAIHFSDLDLDEDLDMVVQHSYPNFGLVTIWENDGTPWGQWASTEVDDVDRIESLYVEDINSDGYPDITGPGHDSSGFVYAWENDGTPFGGSWTRTVIGQTGASTDGIAVADFDKDGQMDIMTGDYSNDIYLWKATGDPFSDNWNGDIVATVDSGPIVMSIAYLDNNEIPDVVMRSLGRTLTVYAIRTVTTDSVTEVRAELSLRVDDPDGTPVYSEIIDVPVSGKIDVSFEWTPTTDGDHTLYISVEPLSIEDSDWFNNGVQREISVKERPPFWIVDDTLGRWAHFNKIQDAINFAIDNETILVFDGYYEENVVIDKLIWVIGNSSMTTTIDGSGNYDTVFISADYVSFSGFLVTNSGKRVNSNRYYDAGIELRANHCTISDCVVDSNGVAGIYLFEASNNSILRNKCTNNTGEHNSGWGILTIFTSGNIIRENTCYDNNDDGIYLKYGHYNSVIDNICKYNTPEGIDLTYSDSNLIEGNIFSHNTRRGIIIANSDYNIIRNNEVTNNREQGLFIFPYGGQSVGNLVYYNAFVNNGITPQGKDTCNENLWDNGSIGNFWSDYSGPDADGDGIGDIPYNIDGSANAQDRYPLMGYGPYSFKIVEYRIAGKPGNVVKLSITQNSVETDVTSLIRTTGAPNVTSFRFYIDSRATIDLTFQFTACEGNTDTPVWIIIDGKKEKVTTFEATDDPDTWYQEYQLLEDLVGRLLS